MTLRNALFVLLSAACAAASAADGDVRVADAVYGAHARVAEHALTLNGAGLRKIFFVKVYAAGLYVPAPSREAAPLLREAGPRLMRLTLQRNVDGADFVKALDEGLADNLSPEALAALKPDIEALHALMNAIGDVKEGDVVDFEWLPEAGTVVKVNGRAAGRAIAGKALYDAVLSIWIGEKPIDASLKAALLGAS